MLPSAWVYILTNQHNTTLYVGVTNDLPTRLWEHRTKQNPGSFTSKYNLFKLVNYKAFDSITEAITREKVLKIKTRKRKEELIEKMNPGWDDLTGEIGEGSGGR
jgi:putative endonuclease